MNVAKDGETITITFGGVEPDGFRTTDILLDVCELSARYIRLNKNDHGDGTYSVDEFRPLNVRDIETFIENTMSVI